MDSEEFIRSWREGLIPEPDDPEVHGDFMVWEALVEELVTVESKLSPRKGSTSRGRGE